MDAAIESVRISPEGRDQLIRLKRITGLRNWNVLCRWALCVSLADSSKPSELALSGEAAVQMEWDTFAGQHGDVFLALLRERCHREGLEGDGASLRRQLHLHIHRGIAHLASDLRLKSLEDLFRKLLGVRTGSGTTGNEQTNGAPSLVRIRAA